MCGRITEFKKIQNLIDHSIENSEPILVEVMGKQGVGKTTLITWIYQEMKRNNRLHNAPLVFLNATSNPEDYNGLAFYRQVITKFFESHILEEIAIESLQKFIILLDSRSECKNSLYMKFSGLDIANIKKDISNIRKILKNDHEFIWKVIELLKENYYHVKTDIRVNSKFLITLWASLTPATSFNAENTLKGYDEFDGFNVKTDSIAFENLKDISNLNLWINSERATIIIVIDHLEILANFQKEANYTTLFSLLAKLRQFSHFIIFLSGTLDAFDAIEEVLGQDQKDQLRIWGRNLTLSAFDQDTVVEIVGKFLAEFWKDKPYSPSAQYPLYPFGSNAVKYIYDTNQKDLRKTLEFLYSKIDEFKSQGKIRVIMSFFQGIKEYRQRADILLSEFEQKYFIEELFNDKIQDKERSSKVEIAIYDLLRILKSSDNYQFISDVKHEPPIGPNNEKPDILIEFFGRQIDKDIKKLAIEVKMFRKSQEVSSKDVKKTHILLKSKKIDYLLWLTNVPLSHEKYNIAQDLLSRIGRTTEMSSMELAYASFACFFNEIFMRSPNDEESFILINKMGIILDEIKNKLIELDKFVVDKQQRITIIDEKPIAPLIVEKAAKKIFTVPKTVFEFDDKTLGDFVEKIINKKKNVQNSLRKTTIIGQINKEFHILLETEEDIHRISILCDKIADKLGLRHTPASVMFT